MNDNRFIEYLCGHGLSVDIFLTNGIRLNGVIAAVRPAEFYLIREGKAQLIYKHAVATICPFEAIDAETLGDIFANERKFGRD